MLNCGQLLPWLVPTDIAMASVNRALQISSQIFYLCALLPYHTYLFWRLSKRSPGLPGSLVLLGLPEWVALACQGLPRREGGRGKGSTAHPEYAASVQVIRSVILASTFIAGLNFSTAMKALDTFSERTSSTGAAHEEGLGGWGANRALALAVLLFAAFTAMGIAIWAALNASWLLGAAMYRIESHGGVGSVQCVQEGARAPIREQAHTRVATGDVLLNGIAEDEDHARLVAESATLEVLQEEDPYTRQLQRQLSLMLVALGASFRCFYAAIPVALAAAGPVVFMLSTAALMSVLAYVDHTGPEPAGRGAVRDMCVWGAKARGGRAQRAARPCSVRRIDHHLCTNQQRRRKKRDTRKRRTMTSHVHAGRGPGRE